MALDYTLILKDKVDEKIHQKINNITKLYKNDDFFSSNIYSLKNDYISCDFGDIEIEEEIPETTNISISLNKFSDNILAKKGMMKIIDEIIEITKEDFYFVFNGDVVYYKRENGVVQKDEESSFWKYIK